MGFRLDSLAPVMSYEPVTQPNVVIEPELAEELGTIDAIGDHGVTSKALSEQPLRASEYRYEGKDGEYAKSRLELSKNNLVAESSAAIQIVANSSMSPQQKVDATNYIMTLPDAYAPIEDAATSAALSIEPRNMDEVIQKEYLTGTAKQRAMALEYEEAKLFMQYQQLMNDNPLLRWETVGDVLGSIVPGRIGTGYKMIAQAIGMPEEAQSNLADSYVLPGLSMNLRIREYLHSLPVEEQIEAMRRAADVILNTDEFWNGTSNSFYKLQLFENIFQDRFQNIAEGFDLDQAGLIFDDFNEVMNWVGVGGLVKSVSSMVGRGLIGKARYSSKATRLVNGSNPQAANVALDQVLKGNAEVAKALGTTPEEVLASMTPSTRHILGEHIPQKLAAQYLETEAAINTAKKTSQSRGLWFQGADRNIAVQTMWDSADSFQGAYFDAVNSTIAHSDDGVHRYLTYSQTPSTAFVNLDDAIDAAETLVGKGNAFKVLRENPATSQWEEIADLTKAARHGQFKFIVQDTVPYADWMIPTELSLFGTMPGAVDASGSLMFKNLQGIHGWFKDLNSIAQPEFMQLYNKGVLNTRGIQAELMNRYQAAIKYMPAKSKKKVSDLLSRGDMREEVYSQADLMAKGFSPRERAMYQTYRQVADATHDLANESIRNMELKAGTKAIYMPGFADPMLVRPVQAGSPTLTNAFKDAKSLTLKVLDRDTSMVNDMSRKAIDDALVKGYGIARMKYVDQTIGSDVSYVLVKNPVRDFKQLPKYVLPYKTGYMPRQYKDTYFIVAKGGSYSKTGQAVRTAPNEEHAKRYIEKMRNDRRLDRSIELIAVPERRIAATITGRIELDNTLDTIEGGAGVMFGKRGKMLKSVLGPKQVNLVDPMTALENVIGIASRVAGSGELLRTLESKLYNHIKTHNLVPGIKTIGHTIESGWWNGVMGRVYSLDPTLLKAQRDNILVQDQLDAARSLMEMMNRFLRADDFWKHQMRKTFIGLSGLATRHTSGKTEEFLRNSAEWWSEFNPSAALSTAGFDHWMAGDPLRQMALQASQPMFLSGLSPRMLGKAIMDANSMGSIMRLVDATPMARQDLLGKLNKVHGSKVLGIKHQRYYEAFISHMVKSGYLQQIASHSYRLDAVERVIAAPNGPISTASANIAKGYNSLFSVLGKGFDVGEQTNRIITSSIALQRFVKKHNRVAVSKADFDEVLGDAMNLVLNTTAEAGFAYQRSILRNAFQFLSFRHKALLAVLPQRLGGSKTFDGIEKSLILGGQFFLYGANAVPHLEGIQALSSYFNQRPEFFINEDFYEAWQGGVLDMFVNAAAGTANIRLSKSAAPTGGIVQQLTDIIMGLLENKAPTEVLMGPSWQRMHGITGMVANIMAISSMDSTQFADPEERWVSVSKAVAAGLFKGADRVFHAELEARAQSFLARNGSRISDIDEKTAWVTNVLGATTSNEEVYYDAMGERDSQYLLRKDFIQSWTEAYVEMIKKEIAIAKAEFDVTGDMESYRRVTDRAILFNQIPNAIFNPSEAYEIAEAVEQYMTQDVYTNKTDSLIMQLLEAGTGGLDETQRLRAQIMVKHPDMSEEDKALLNQFIEDYEEGTAPMHDAIDYYKQTYGEE